MWSPLALWGASKGAALPWSFNCLASCYSRPRPPPKIRFRKSYAGGSPLPLSLAWADFPGERDLCLRVEMASDANPMPERPTLPIEPILYFEVQYKD